MKPSTVSKYENSQSKAKDVGPPEALNTQSSGDQKTNVLEETVHVASPFEKLNQLNFVEIESERKPAIKLYTQMSTESVLLPEPDVEIKDDREEYTGFTIAEKDRLNISLRLKRQESLKALKPVLDILRREKEEKLEDSRENIEVFSNAHISNVVRLPPNPYSNPEDIWCGLELTVVKKDETKSYVLMSHGLAKWIIEEPKYEFFPSPSSDSEINYWEVNTAEIVRENGKGPYVKLNIDNENAVCLKPEKASDDEYKRFKTDNYQLSPSIETSKEEMKLNSNVEHSQEKPAVA